MNLKDKHHLIHKPVSQSILYQPSVWLRIHAHTLATRGRSEVAACQRLLQILLLTLMLSHKSHSDFRPLHLRACRSTCNITVNSFFFLFDGLNASRSSGATCQTELGYNLKRVAEALFKL